MTRGRMKHVAPPGRQGQKRYGGGGRRPAPSLASHMSHLAVIFAREIPVQTRCPDQYLRERRRVDRTAAVSIALLDLSMRSGVVDDVAKTPASPGVGGVPRPLELTDARDDQEEQAAHRRALLQSAKAEVARRPKSRALAAAVPVP